MLVAPNSGKSIVGRDWLVALRYKKTQPIEKGECEVNNQSVNSDNLICEASPENQQSPQVQQLQREFPKLCKRKRRVTTTKLKVQ